MPQEKRHLPPAPKAKPYLLSTTKTKRHLPSGPNTGLTAFMVKIGSRYNPPAREIVSPWPARSKASESDMGFPVRVDLVFRTGRRRGGRPGW